MRIPSPFTILITITFFAVLSAAVLSAPHQHQKASSESNNKKYHHLNDGDTMSPKTPSQANNNNNVFQPISAIVTKNGGAITTMKATLDPPITTEGYHQVTLSWCDRQGWFDCIKHWEDNSTECRCAVAGRDVEESVRFSIGEELAGDDDDERDPDQNNNNIDSSSSCTVVSQRWSRDEYFVLFVKKFRDELKFKIGRETRLSRYYGGRLEKTYRQLDTFLETANNDNDASTVTDEILQKLARLEDEAVKLRKLIEECDANIERWSKAKKQADQLKNLGRVMNLEIFCKKNTDGKNSIINFSELTAQATFAKARWEPSHILLIDTSDENDTNEKKKDTSASSSSEVRMAAKLSHETHCDWKDVKVSLRQGAPGEDTTTLEDPPNDSPIEPWLLTVNDKAPRVVRGNAHQQQNIHNHRNNHHFVAEQEEHDTSATINVKDASEAALEAERAFRDTHAMPKRKTNVGHHTQIDAMMFTSTPTMTRTLSESASSSTTSTTDRTADEQADDEEDDEEERRRQHQQQQDETRLGAQDVPPTDIVGSVTEETKLPHRVSVPRNSYSIVEIGSGKVHTKMHRVAAAYRCRYQTSSSNSICSLPVFLRANVTNTNKFSILGGPTRVIVDGVPFNPFGRARINSTASYGEKYAQQQFQQVQRGSGASFRPAIAPESWGCVELGEDTRVTIQRYEKSNIMSASQAQQGKGWWEKLLISNSKKHDEDEGARNQVKVKFEMKVTNTRKTAVTIDLRDQFPRTNSDEIEIKLDGETLKNKILAVKSLPTATDNTNDGDSASSSSSSPSPSSCSYRHPTDKTKCISTRNGGEELQWNVEVGPSGTVVIPFGFTVTWPKKKFVHGLA